MSRRDLLEWEITQIQNKARRVARGEPWDISTIDADRLLRLTGELLELRNREAHSRHLHGLEGDY